MAVLVDEKLTELAARPFAIPENRWDAADAADKSKS